MDTALFDLVRRHFADEVAHVRACGMVLGDVAADRARVTLPWSPRWLGDAERGLIHTGAISTLVDTTMGLVVFAAQQQFQPIATLDLRLDYLRAARRPVALHCEARCDRVTRHIAFATARVWQEGEEDAIVATATAAFMLGARRSRRQPEAGEPAAGAQ